MIYKSILVPLMARCRLAASHYPTRSHEQCRHRELYVVIRLKLVNFITSFVDGSTVNGTGARVHHGQQATVCPCPDAWLHNVQRASAWPDNRVHNGEQATVWPDTRVPGTQQSTAHCVAGTRVHRVLHTLDVAADNGITADFRLARPIEITWRGSVAMPSIPIHCKCMGEWFVLNYSIHVPGWLQKWLNLITAPGSVSNEPGSVTCLTTKYLKTVSWRNHTEKLTTLWPQNISFWPKINIPSSYFTILMLKLLGKYSQTPVWQLWDSCQILELINFKTTWFDLPTLLESV